MGLLGMLRQWCLGRRGLGLGDFEFMGGVWIWWGRVRVRPVVEDILIFSLEEDVFFPREGS